MFGGMFGGAGAPRRASTAGFFRRPSLLCRVREEKPLGSFDDSSADALGDSARVMLEKLAARSAKKSDGSEPKESMAWRRRFRFAVPSSTGCQGEIQSESLPREPLPAPARCSLDRAALGFCLSRGLAGEGTRQLSDST